MVDAKKDVFVYTAAGAPLGQWSAGGINQPQDIATLAEIRLFQRP